MDRIVQLTYFLGHAITTLLTAGLGYWTLHRPEMRARRWLGLFLGTTSFWSGLAAVAVWLSWDPAQILVWALWSGTATVVSLFLVVFASAYTGRQWRTDRFVQLYAVTGALIFSVALTAPLHSLYWVDFTVLHSPFPHLSTVWGPVQWLNIGYAFASLCAACYYLGTLYLRSRRKPRTALLVFLFGLIVGAVPLVASTLGVGIETYNYSSFGQAIFSAAIAYAVVRLDLSNITPVARDQAIEDLTDPFLAVDTDDRLVDFNTAAQQLLDGIDDSAIGAPLSDIAPDLAGQLENTPRTDGSHRNSARPPVHGEKPRRNPDADSPSDSGTELVVEQHGATRTYDVTHSPIRTQDNHRDGTEILLREITALKRREEDLDLMRQVQSRVLRHNIRNELQIIKAYSEVFADELDGEHAEMARTIVEKTDEIVTTSSKIRAVEQIIDQKKSPTRLNLSDVLERIVQTHRVRFPDVSFTLECPDQCQVVIIPQIRMAIKNLVENAAEHNDAASPAVEITVADNEGVVITISDNGPGIPRNELTVLDQPEESPLEHGSGVGLWVIDRVIEKANATMEYQTSQAGTTVSIRIPQTDDSAPDYST